MEVRNNFTGRSTLIICELCPTIPTVKGKGARFTLSSSVFLDVLE